MTEKNTFKNQNYFFSSTHVCHKQVITVITSPKQHGTSMKGSQTPCSLKMTKILSIRWCQDTFFSHHAVWDECNKQVHHQPRGLKSSRDQKGEAKPGGTVTCDNTTSDLMTTHPSKVFALHTALIAVWFSTDMYLHTNAGVTNLSICPFSHGRKQCEYYRNVEGYCYGSCQSCNTKPLWLLPTTWTLVDLLQGHFTVFYSGNYIRGVGWLNS